MSNLQSRKVQGAGSEVQMNLQTCMEYLRKNIFNYEFGIINVF